MLRQIPMYLVLAAHLAFSVLYWFVPNWFEREWVLLCVTTPQTLMLAVWLVLGRANAMTRLLVNLAALGYWAQFLINDHFDSMFEEYLALLLAVIVGATGLMRALGWRIEKLAAAELSQPPKAASRPPQLTLRKSALLLAAISVLFAINARWNLTDQVFRDNELLAIFLLTAISAVLALWAALGQGGSAKRLLIYAALSSTAITGIVVIMPEFANDVEFALAYFVPDVLVIPLTLLAFRIAGYRVMRRATESTRSEVAVAVGIP